MSEKRLVVELFELAGINVCSPNPWDINIFNDGFYSRALNEKNLGLGESYMDHWWECERLDEFFFRILKANLPEKIRTNLKTSLGILRARLFNLQTVRRSRRVASTHYNLDKDLFLSFLDPHLQYSCGYFENTDNLDKAQIDKLDLIIAKLDLKSSDHLLDIGCGWGGLARYVAEKVGCRVTGVNISTEQTAFAQDYCKGLPVEIVYSDYRHILGSFDKIVSVGMFEHVGSKNYKSYMDVIQRTLKDDGIFLLHTIGSNESYVTTDSWINKYIFPNGLLPSPEQVGKAIEKRFVMEDWHNFGPYYDQTLMAWNSNFQKCWPGISHKYDGRFKRMWEYYLLSCAGAFRARRSQVWQIVLTKTGRKQPACRL